jgi:HK97 family phage major capsid protein
MEDLIKELGVKMDTMKKESVSQEQYDSLKAEFATLKEQGVNKTAIETLTQKLDDLALMVNDIESKGFKGENKDSLVDVIKENKEQLKEMSKGKTGEITVKANLVRASIATNPLDLMLSGVGQIARRARSLYDFFPKVQVGNGNHNGTIAYIDWDEATTVRAAANVAEGVAFAESTATFKGYTLPLRKIGDTLPVSEEFFEDEVMAAAELERFLLTNVEDRIDTQIVTGDNTGQNLAGLVSSTPAYTPVASGIASPNIYDLCVKVAESITNTGGAKYRPDFVAMNIVDINKLRLQKDSQFNYIFDRTDDRIVSLNIIEDNNVVANTMYVGDSRFATIYEMGGVVLSEGMINAQFTSDFRTIKARKRLAFLIREADKTGFRRVTSISAALTTLAT